MWSIAINVTLSIHLSVCSHISKTTRSKFTDFSTVEKFYILTVAIAQSSDDNATLYVLMYGFMGDVIFSHTGHFIVRQVKLSCKIYIFVLFKYVGHNGSHCRPSYQLFVYKLYCNIPNSEPFYIKIIQRPVIVTTLQLTSYISDTDTNFVSVVVAEIQCSYSPTILLKLVMQTGYKHTATARLPMQPNWCIGVTRCI